MDGTSEFAAPTGMGGGVPDLGTPASPQVQPEQPQQPSPQDVSLNHDTLFGRAAKTLMGNNTSYHVDQNGNTVAVNSPNSFQSFARNVLSASLLGAAAGANGNPEQGFAGGFARGGAAGYANQERQDLIKRQQAETDFKNNMVANQDQREQQAAVTTEQLRKAQIARSNADTYRLNVATQGMSLDQHQKIADMGKAHMDAYDKSGIQPIFKDIPETEMKETIANRPGGANLDWAATGVKVGLGADGEPTYQSTYSAYDPKGEVTVTQAQVDQWKKDGLDKYHPELFSVVKAGKTLSTQEFIALKQADERQYATNLVRENSDLKTEETKSKIKENNAQAASALASAAHSRAATGAIQAEKTKQQALSNAYDELNKAGGDFDKLTPKSKIIIGESAASLIPSMNAQVKELLSDVTDPAAQEKARTIMTQIDDIRSLSMQAIKHGAANPENGQGGSYVSNGTVYNIPANDVAGFLKAHPDAKLTGNKNQEAAPTADLSKISPEQTALTSPTGGVQIVDNSAVDKFLQNNPTYKVLGAGKKQSQAAEPYIR